MLEHGGMALPETLAPRVSGPLRDLGGPVRREKLAPWDWSHLWRRVTSDSAGKTQLLRLEKRHRQLLARGECSVPVVKCTVNETETLGGPRDVTWNRFEKHKKDNIT